MSRYLTDKWILDEQGNHVPVDLYTWAAWLEVTDRRVLWTRVEDVIVSTVFMGLDMGFSDEGPPLLYETMAWREVPDDGVNHGRHWIEGAMRYATREQALNGHAEIVERVYRARVLTGVLEPVIVIEHRMLPGPSEESL